MAALLSFHGDKKLKAKYLRRLRAHHKADEIVKGRYWQNGKGCAVGCLTHDPSGGHEQFPELFGLPEWLARLIDTLFEGLPNGHAKEFPLRVWKAIPEGKDLEPVKHRFCSYLMQENLDRVERLNISDDLKNQVKDAIQQVKALHDKAITDGWDESAWSAAQSAARSAAQSAQSAAESARSAAESAARSAARSAAESAAESAWSAAESAWSAQSAAQSAAWSAAQSAAQSAWSAWSAAQSAAYIRHADKLIELLATAS